MAAAQSTEDMLYLGDVVDAVKNILTSAASNVESGVKTVEDALSAPFKAVTAVSQGVGSTVKLLPIVLIILALSIGGYLIFRGKSEKGGLL